jgi:hypothetical protein
VYVPIGLLRASYLAENRWRPRDRLTAAIWSEDSHNCGGCPFAILATAAVACDRSDRSGRICRYMLHRSAQQHEQGGDGRRE